MRVTVFDKLSAEVVKAQGRGRLRNKPVSEAREQNRVRSIGRDRIMLGQIHS